MPPSDDYRHRLVRVGTGLTNVQLPDGISYEGDALVLLSDREWRDISPSAFSGGTLVDLGSVGFVTATFGGPEVAHTETISSPTYDLDLRNGNVQYLTLDDDVDFTITGVEVESSARSFTVFFDQGTGGWTISFADTILWPEGTAPTFSTGVGEVDAVVFVVGPDGTFYGFLSGVDLS